MPTVLACFGILICAVSIGILASPATVQALAGSLKISTPLRLLGAGVRIAIGEILIIFSPQVASSAIVFAIGVVFLTAGFALLFMRNETLQSLLDWCSKASASAIRLVAVPTAAFGMLLIYASGIASM